MPLLAPVTTATGRVVTRPVWRSRRAAYPRQVDRRPLLPLPVPAGAGALQVRAALARALSGAGPAVVPHAADSAPADLPEPRADDLPDGLALVVGTSGSTGTPKRALLTASALRASARATHERARRPGPVAAGHAGPPRRRPAGPACARSWPAPSRGPWTPAPASPSTRSPRPPPPWTPRSRATTPRWSPPSWSGCCRTPGAGQPCSGSTRCSLGGAAAPSALLAAAESAAVRVLTTYGMSETAGGCVYDGQPLRVQPRAGRGRRAHPARRRHPRLGLPGTPRPDRRGVRRDADGLRWFRTDDLGSLDAGRPARRRRAGRRRHQHRRAQGGSPPGRGGPAQPRARGQRGGRRRDPGPGVGRGGRRGGRPRRRPAATSRWATRGRPCAASCPARRCPAGSWSWPRSRCAGPASRTGRDPAHPRPRCNVRSSYALGLKERDAASAPALVLLGLTIYAAGRLRPDRGVAAAQPAQGALVAADPALPAGRADRLARGRPARAADARRGTNRPPAPRGPDDDPDFLRNL